MKICVGAFALALAVASLGCREKAVAVDPGAPVILISIDTLRSDHLPAYGYTGVATPHLDRFRRDAILFERAYAPTPMTLPSHVTMLTGLQPNRHGVRNNVGFTWDTARFPAVTHALRAAGYTTGAAVSSYVLRGESGMAAAFDVYDDAIDPYPGAAFSEYQRDGRATTKVASAWVSQNAARPFFYFLHIYEPHVPYDPPEPFRSRYGSPYDGEIANADEIVGEFLEHLRRIGVYDRALIIITSDHGEGLGDHGEDQHSVLVYREALQVPLFIKLPDGKRGGETVREPVQLADLAPTILRIVDLASEATTFDGTVVAEGPLQSDRQIYGESLFPLIHLGWSELRSLIVGRHHYIESPRPELYDLVSDPGERRNVIQEERRTASALRSTLQSIGKGEVTPSAVDPETARKLAALGYLGSPAAGAVKSRLNPVEHIGFLEELRDAFETAAGPRPAEAIPVMKALLERYSDALELRIRLAEVLTDQLQDAEAAAQYEEAMRRAPVPLPDVALQAAALHLRARRMKEAEAAARAALPHLPGRANEMLARIEMARADHAAASRYADAAWDADRSPAQLLLRAEVAQRNGDLTRTLSLIEEAAALAAKRGDQRVYRLHFLRADTLAKMDRFDEAIAEYDREVAAFPGNLDAWAGLSVLHFMTGNRAAGDRTVQQMVERNPNARAREIAARTYEAFGDEATARRWRRSPN